MFIIYCLSNYIVIAESIKHCRGNYTTAQINRCAQMSGPFGKQVDRLIVDAGLMTETIASGTRSPKADPYRSDLHLLVEKYAGGGLFRFVPGRSHRSFPHARHACQIVNPQKLGVHLRTLAEERDFWEDLRQQTNTRQAQVRT